MRVLGRANSVNVRKVMWCSAELGLAVTREDFGRGYAPVDAPEFRAANPFMRVPVLIDGDVTLWESNTIVRYLCAAYGDDTMLPREPAARAHVEKWMDWQAGLLHAPITTLFWELVVEPGTRTAAEMAAAAAEAHGRMRVLDAVVAQHEFVAGPTITAADFAVGPSLHRYFHMPIDRPPLAALEAYRDRLEARPAYREHVAIGSP